MSTTQTPAAARTSIQLGVGTRAEAVARARDAGLGRDAQQPGATGRG